MGKRGPSKLPGKRKNGRLTPEARIQAFDREEIETMAVGIEARMRHHGLREDAARDQEAGWTVGRMWRQGSLTTPQRDAALQYLADRTRFRKLDGMGRDVSAQDLNRVHGLSVLSEFEQIEAAKRAAFKFRAAERCILDEQRAIGLRGNLFGALEAIVFRDVYVAHLERDLRIALNALARHYGLMTRAVA